MDTQEELKWSSESSSNSKPAETNMLCEKQTHTEQITIISAKFSVDV